MTEPEPDPQTEPPLVIPVESAVPVVIPADPPKPRLPRPGFWEALVLTIGFAVALFGTVFAVVGVAILWLVLTGGADAMKPPAGAETGSVASIPPDLIGPLVWSFPIGYTAGLLYCVLVLRVVVGRGWTHEIGLRRLPRFHLGLGLLALPGFVILSDVLARLLFQLFRMEALAEQNSALGELLKPFHWSIAVLAIGIGPGLVEELWCRGFLGRGLVGRYGWARGVVLTSLFFGLLHLFPPPYVLVTAAMGACLHFTYVMSRSLWVPIILHMLNNSFAALAALGVVPTEGIDRAAENNPGLMVALAAGLLLSTAAAMWTARARLVADDGSPGQPPHRGVLVPPPDSGVRVENRAPHVLLAVACVGFSAGLVILLKG